MRYLIAITLAIALVSCKSEQDLVENTQTTLIETEVSDSVEISTPGKPQRPYDVKAEIGDPNQRSDNFEIVNAYITGNYLYMEIRYTGGCGWHKYKFVGSPAISKSLPPQRHVRLIHDNDNDQCESLVNQTIQVDLKALAYSTTPGSEIVLILDGFNENLNYIYE